MQYLFDFILSTQRTLRGVLAGHTLMLFDSADRFALGMAVAAATAALTHGTIAVLLVLVAGRVLSPLGRSTRGLESGALVRASVATGTIVPAATISFAIVPT